MENQNNMEIVNECLHKILCLHKIFYMLDKGIIDISDLKQTSENGMKALNDLNNDLKELYSAVGKMFRI